MEIPQESAAGPTPPHFAHKFTVFQEFGKALQPAALRCPIVEQWVFIRTEGYPFPFVYPLPK